MYVDNIIEVELQSFVCVYYVSFVLISKRVFSVQLSLTVSTEVHVFLFA